MDDTAVELNELFGSPNAALPQEVLLELQSLLRLHSISPQELFYKWESYSIKMGSETALTLKTVRDFKKDIQDALERETRAKAAHTSTNKRTAAPAGRAGASNADVFGVLDGLVPSTPHGASRTQMNGSAAKRKSNFDTPAAKATKSSMQSSPLTPHAANGVGGAPTSFAERPNAGQIMETLNHHIPLPEPPTESPGEPRVKLKANTEISKFAYKTMAMKLSEASEILDDRIDEFLQIVQTHHKLEDSAFGNPASQSTSEIIAVGRIASDSSEGKLNAASLVLETSRRTGAGLRVPLRVDSLQMYNFFPGQIVAVRGSNPAGSFFMAKELLEIPLLPSAASSPSDLDMVNGRLAITGDMDIDDSESNTRPLSIHVASGPYTPGHILDFAAFHALMETTLETRPDVLVLNGPFLDIEHPSLINGDFEIPDSAIPNPDKATLKDVFRYHISQPINKLVASHPTITIIIQPSVRDAIAKHVSYPQDRLKRQEFGLPRQATIVTNPVTISINEIIVGITSLDILDMLRREECVSDKAKMTNAMVRWGASLISQRSFCPIFPPTAREVLPKIDADRGGAAATEEEDAERVDLLPVGAMLDTSYMKLTEWLNVRPDVLITPSALTPFAKVINSVLVINPGTLSKKRGPGTFARMTVLPATITDEEREQNEVVAHKLFERSRVDIVHI
ncbi:putative dna polymerase alpha primase associated subunit protein [Neofusicoccum parvum UCRNP2]|uniref:DNA polymerase alpha subunit B n=1 Tax=Botryosphaeria parva (strain UCR-NP2) TaxID=1287680 RepID=R1GAG8_BOTPV|nr:putative dna polymerase alpha primase associated subunit protein [Neofusicoccum parvum UCRNP2]